MLVVVACSFRRENKMGVHVISMGRHDLQSLYGIKFVAKTCIKCNAPLKSNKQQVLKAVKMKWKKAVREGSSVMPWFLFRDMIRNGWFYVTYSR